MISSSSMVQKVSAEVFLFLPFLWPLIGDSSPCRVEYVGPESRVNSRDVVANIRWLMAGEEQESMLPWWRGFKGTIKKTAKHKYDMTGIVCKLNGTTVEITEFPIHRWTQTYKAALEAMIGEKGDGVVKVRGTAFDRRFKRQQC